MTLTESLRAAACRHAASASGRSVPAGRGGDRAVETEAGGAEVSEKRGYEVAEEACAAFDRWLAEQSDDVQELGLLEQIELYATADSEP